MTLKQTSLKPTPTILSAKQAPSVSDQGASSHASSRLAAQPSWMRASHLWMALPLAMPIAIAASTPADAVSFNFDFAPTVPEELKQASEEAASLWSPLLKDDVVVRLQVGYSDLSEAGSVLGGVQPGKVKVKYEDYTDALLKDAVSSSDWLGINNLPLSAKGNEALQNYQAGNIALSKVELESKEFAFLMDGQFADRSQRKRSGSANYLDNNGNNNNKQIQLTRAQAKALNLIDTTSDKLDAAITINSNANLDFSRADGISSNQYDAVSVMQHEIGHALGIVSGVDMLDFLASTSEPTDIEDIEKNKFSYLTPMDFYRYSEESAELGVADLTIGGSEKYFSLDGGKSAITDASGRAAFFSTGSTESDGDGFQGSHWKAAGDPLGVMTPLLRSEQQVDITQLDLTLLDAIGWDLEDSTSERAAAIGIDWDDLTEEMAGDRKATIDALREQWGSDIPGFEAAVSEAASELDFKFRQKLQEKFDSFEKKFNETDSGDKRSEERQKFYKAIAEESAKRNEEIGKLPEDIYKTDLEVREWLALPTDKLAKEMQEADGATINRLSNIVKTLPSDQQRDIEEKLEDAVSLFADKPNKLVRDLLDDSGPVNPIGWNSYLRWYWWWLEGEEAEGDFADDYEDVPFYALQAAQESQDIPEPASILAMFGIAAIGASAVKRRSR